MHTNGDNKVVSSEQPASTTQFVDISLATFLNMCNGFWHNDEFPGIFAPLVMIEFYERLDFRNIAGDLRAQCVVKLTKYLRINQIVLGFSLFYCP